MKEYPRKGTTYVRACVEVVQNFRQKLIFIWFSYIEAILFVIPCFLSQSTKVRRTNMSIHSTSLSIGFGNIHFCQIEQKSEIDLVWVPYGTDTVKCQLVVVTIIKYTYVIVRNEQCHVCLSLCTVRYITTNTYGTVGTSWKRKKQKLLLPYRYRTVPYYCCDK